MVFRPRRSVNRPVECQGNLHVLFSHNANNRPTFPSACGGLPRVSVALQGTFGEGGELLPSRQTEMSIALWGLWSCLQKKRRKSGWADLNRRPLAPQASTLNQLRYSPILCRSLPSGTATVKVTRCGVSRRNALRAQATLGGVWRTAAPRSPALPRVTRRHGCLDDDRAFAIT